MLRRLIKAFTSQKQQRTIKTWMNSARKWWIKQFRSYDAAALSAALTGMGIASNDTLMVHANFKPDSGFSGVPGDIVTVLVDLVGERGNLMMVSIPFRDTAYDYLLQGKPFNVRKTMSMMGLVTEMFRRRKGTLRSLHPTHPVLAIGKEADWLVEGHENCLFPCGVGTPFDKFLQRNGKILFFDVGFGAITFFHYVEDVVKDALPFPAYEEKLFAATVIDQDGNSRTVNTYAFSTDVKRDTDRLLERMDRQGMILRRRVGNSNLILVSASDVLSVMQSMVNAGDYPYSPINQLG